MCKKTLRNRTKYKLYYLRLKMVISWPRIQRVIHLEKIQLAQKILQELSFSRVYCLCLYLPSFLVNFEVLGQKPRKKLNQVSISVLEILFVQVFSGKRQQSLFTFHSFCIILVNSFLEELSNLCQSAICINMKVNKLSQKISNSRKETIIFKRRQYTTY